MKRALIILLLIGCLLLCCANEENLPTITQTEVGGVVANLGEPPIDKNWLNPAKVEIGKFYAGAEADWDLRVHNGNNDTTIFSITYRYPDNVGVGFAKPTVEVKNWVTVNGGTGLIEIPAKSTAAIPIVLKMPKNAPPQGKTWEFWVSVQDGSQTGMVRTELCQRVLVTMR